MLWLPSVSGRSFFRERSTEILKEFQINCLESSFETL